jgi:hypothetical protein
MRSHRCRFFCLISALSVFATAFSSWAQDAAPSSAPSAAPPVYLQVETDKPLRLSSLKPGDVIEGRLARDVYSAHGELFASGSNARLAVDHVERRRRTDSGRWPWVVGVFTPRWQRFPVFTEARIVGANDAISTLPISMVSSGRKTEIVAMAAKGARKGKPCNQSPNDPAKPPADSKLGPELLLETHDWGGTVATGGSATAISHAAAAQPEAPAGTRCRILLLDDIRSSSNHANDPVRAVLLEPVVAEHQVVFPAGSVFEGTVTKAVRPRILSRAGTLSIAFSNVAIPGGVRVPATFSVVGVEMDSSSKLRIDEEGRMHGGPPGLKWLLIDGGVTAGLAKITDDGTQLAIEAIVSSATDASTAGTARIAGICVSGIFMITRHGRDVRLPKYTEMTVTLDRPVPREPLPGPGSAALQAPLPPAVSSVTR